MSHSLARVRGILANPIPAAATTARTYASTAIGTGAASHPFMLIPACDDHMQHLLALHEAVFAKYRPRFWAWEWRAWATENHSYLKVKRDLFDCPGDSPVGGSAHVITDRGFLFLFAVGGKRVRASMVSPK